MRTWKHLLRLIRPPAEAETDEDVTIDAREADAMLARNRAERVTRETRRLAASWRAWRCGNPIEESIFPERR